MDFPTYPGITNTAYFFDRRQTYGQFDLHQWFGPNIGRAGENLTISFLSLNRAALSIRLLDSLQAVLGDFEGKILVIDNGSDREELDLLREACAGSSLPVRLVELEKNLGVSGGRNHAIQQLETDWVMFLDNDMYFVRNPIPSIHRCINALGVHFLNLPILNPDRETFFAFGGHLYLYPYKDTTFIAGGSVGKSGDANREYEPFLSTFLFGGASVIHKQTFLQQGGFDEGMFVGFEDIDFSLRLFRAGLKIGNLGLFSLVHAHEAPEKESDKKYESGRFSNPILRASADHFFRKHGMHVWNDGVEDWLKAKHESLGLEGEAQKSVDAVVLSNKKRIGLVTDTNNWAFANIAKQLKKNLSDRFEIEILAAESDCDHLAQAFLRFRHFDLVHFFWRAQLNLIKTGYFEKYFADRSWDYGRFLSDVLPWMRITTSVYDHLFLSKEEIEERKPVFQKIAPHYTVCSERLNQIYRKIADYPDPACVIEDGVDLERFYPNPKPRMQREIAIGWAGNSKWNAENGDFKGLETLIKPAIAALQSEGLPVRGVFADRANAFIPHEAMVDFYHGIDLYVCASLIEGTPNPVLESMACGLPVISTDVGIVPQLFGPKQQEFILPERSLEHLIDALRKLVISPTLRRDLAAENLEVIERWSWHQQAEKFGKFFEAVLNG